LRVRCCVSVCCAQCVVCGVRACLLWPGGGVWVGPWGSGCGCDPVPLPLSVYPWLCCWWGVPWVLACTPGVSAGGCTAGRMTKAHHVIVMGLKVLGYSEGVPSMLLRNTPSMVSGMSVMKTSASDLAQCTGCTYWSIHACRKATHAT